MNLTVKYIEQILRDETVRQSGHEERVGILSMSSLHLDDEEILKNYKNGSHVDIFNHMKFYRGTLAETGFVERIVKCGVFSVVLVNHEISAYDKRLTGHIDIILPNENVIFKYKSVPTINSVMEICRKAKPQYKVFCQVQSYLRWGGYDKAFIIYEAREGGYPSVIQMTSDYNMQRDLVTKAERLLQKIEEMKR